MSGDFEAQLEIGRLGERLVEVFLKRSGEGVIPSYDYSGKDGQKAPRLQLLDRSLAIPDLDRAIRGWRRWGEVKTYRSPVPNRRRGGLLVHGFENRLFRQYLKVCELTGTTCQVLVLEYESGWLLGIELEEIESCGFDCECGGCVSVPQAWCRAPDSKGFERGRYWPRNAMKPIHRFTDAELDPIRTLAAAAARKRGAA
jgi:hypothetical protein